MCMSSVPSYDRLAQALGRNFSLRYVAMSQLQVGENVTHRKHKYLYPEAPTEESSLKAGRHQNWPNCQHETEVKDDFPVERETSDRRGLGRANLKNCLLRSALYFNGEYAPWLQLVRAWWHERLIADSKGLPLPEGSHLCRLAHHPPPFYLKVTEGTWVYRETTSLSHSIITLTLWVLSMTNNSKRKLHMEVAGYCGYAKNSSNDFGCTNRCPASLARKC